MAEETRERSTTTWAEKPEAVIGDLNNDLCWLYLMKGLGSDRDKRLALGVLRAFLQTITGEFKVVGQDGTTSITNLLLSIADSNNYRVEIGPQSLTFKRVQEGGGVSLTLTKDGLTVNSSTGETVTITNGSVTVAKDDYSAVLKKNGVVVTLGDYETLVSSNGVTVEKEGGSTAIFSSEGANRVRRVYSSASPVSYSVSSWPKSASDVKASITDSTVVRLNDGTSDVMSKKFKLDWTPAVDTEVVVDYQCSDTTPLKILNKDDNLVSDDGFVLQAPNTVRRYVYKGSTTGWECLY